MYGIRFTKQADKTLRKMPKNWAQRIRGKIVQIAQDPHKQHSNVTKLQERPGFRLRVGDWRVIYEVEDDELITLVLRIAPRGGTYR